MTKVLNEEIDKQGEIDLGSFEKSDFWGNIRVGKLIMLGCDIEFQTVASNVIPVITNEAISVVTDKVAKLEYGEEEVESVQTLKTFGDFNTLMRASEAWTSGKGKAKWLTLYNDITIELPKPYESYKQNDKARDIHVRVWVGNEEANLLGGKETSKEPVTVNDKTGIDNPIPLDILFANTYTAKMEWHRVQNESRKRALQNVESWKTGRKGAEKETGIITIASLLKSYDGETELNGSYTISFPNGDPKYKLVIPATNEKTLIADVKKMVVYFIGEESLTKTISGATLLDLLFKDNKPITDDQLIVASFDTLFSKEKRQDNKESENLIDILTINDLGKLDALTFFSGVNVGKNSSGLSNVGKNSIEWTYTTPKTKIAYTIKFDYTKDETLLKNVPAITIMHEGKPYKLKSNSVFFNNDLVVVMASKDRKTFSFGFKNVDSISKWWKTLVVSTSSGGKASIKTEQAIRKYRDMEIVERQSRMDWSGYWSKMGF